MNTRHAALIDNGLVYREGDSWGFQDVPAMLKIEDLVNLGVNCGFTHIWVMPSTGIVPSREYCQYDASRYDLIIHFIGKAADVESSRARTVTGWRKDKPAGNPQVTIIFLEHTAWYKGAFKALNVYGLLAAVDRLETALGVAIAGSPQAAAWRLLKSLHPAWLADIPQGLKEKHFDRKASQDITWQRTLTKAEVQGGQLCIYKFDRAMSYPASASMTRFGEGTPTLVFHGDDIDQGKIGVWHVTVSGAAHKDTPCPNIKTGDHWLSGPMIRVLRAAGFEVIAHEGHVFMRDHELMKQWAHTLFNWREVFRKQADEMRRQGDMKRFYVLLACSWAIKEIANSGIGGMAARRLEEEEGDIEKRRPDIRVQALGKNTEVMYFNMAKWYPLYGSPAIVYNDAVYYIAPADDAREHFREIVKREGLLGGYKYEGMIALDALVACETDGFHFTGTVRELLKSRFAAWQKLAGLNSVGWE